MIDASTTRAKCPRCGYDQRGVIATWTESCPVSNSCTECGLEIYWAEILNPVFAEPTKWFIEARAPVRGLPRRMLATFLMALRPWRFWRELRMVHEPKWRLAITFIVMLLFMSWLIISMSRAYHAWGVWRSYSLGGACPATVTFPGQTLGPSFSPQVACTTKVTPWQAIWPAVFLPLSNKSPGILTPVPASLAGLNAQYPGNTGITLRSPAYPSPRSLLPMFELRYLASLIALALIITILCPVGFLALPASRFKAKVLWKHIHRIAFYGFVMTWSVGLAVWLFAEPPSYNPAIGLFWMHSDFGSTMVHLYLPAMLIVWWGFAISRYLRMQHAWAVAICIVIMALGVVWFFELTYYNAIFVMP